MNTLTPTLALGGPIHLAVVPLADGQSFHEVPEEVLGPDGKPSALIQVFRYRRELVAAGSGQPINFLIPDHFAAVPGAIAAWVFGVLVRSIMESVPETSLAALVLGFKVADPNPHIRQITAFTHVHSVNGNRMSVRPVKEFDCSTQVDRSMLISLRGGAEEQRRCAAEIAARTMRQALDPIVEMAVKHVMTKDRW
jgi:hypothetical protein